MHAIFCHTLHGVQWETNFHQPFLLSQGITIYRFPISRDEKLLAAFSKTLSSEENAKASRFFKEDDAMRFVISRGALRFLLGYFLQVHPLEIRIVINEDKKPWCCNLQKNQLHFNISHSGDWILITFAYSELGVDVENINRDFSYKEILRNNFNEEEIKCIENSPNPVKTFYIFWTRKEALIKATGQGISDNLPSLSVTNGHKYVNDGILSRQKSFTINSFDVDVNHVGSMATSLQNQSIKFIDGSVMLFFSHPV